MYFKSTYNQAENIPLKRYGWRKTDGNYWTKIYMDDVVGRKVNFIQNVDHRFYMNVNEKDLYKLSCISI